MRLTNKLYAQHLGWMFKKKWAVQRTRKVRDTGAQAELEKSGIKVVDALDILEPKAQYEKVVVVGEKPQKIVRDQTHRNWHEEVCHVYRDDNVLLEGIPQAQVLLKTVEIKEFPRNIEEAINKMKISNVTDKNIQNYILASHVFDAEQEKTAIVKIPERPAYVLPRNYGITDNRKNRLLISKLLYECDNVAGRQVNSQRQIINNAKFIVSLKKDEDKIQFNLTAETFITAKKLIEPVKAVYDSALPDLFPIKHTITIPKEDIYEFRDFYPVKNGLEQSAPHTIFLHYSALDVKNLHETPVTETQFQSRTMIKAFTAAASKAKQLYGNDVKDLAKPIVVQSIQTNGKTFHFGVFQLNTLNLNGTEGTKNYWFHVANMDMFTECVYKVGRPVLEGYNKDVFRCVSALYNNF